jgi:hypothetical protein
MERSRVIDNTPQERIDSALDSVLRASGSALKNYTMPYSLERMREAMRRVMSESYIQGSNDFFKAASEAQGRT